MGCKVYVRRPLSDGGEEERLAEILSIRDKPLNAYSWRPTTTTTRGIKQEDDDNHHHHHHHHIDHSTSHDDQASTATHRAEDRWEYFVHWDQFNKRLDEWVAGSRLVLSQDLEWPRPKPPSKRTGPGSQKMPGKAQRAPSLLKRATANAAAAASPTPVSTPGPGSGPGISTPGRISVSPAPSLKRKALHDEEHGLDEEREQEEEEEEEEEEEPEDDDPDAEGEMDIDAEGELEGETLDVAETPSDVLLGSSPSFSKEQEIEKLRTSGSMTQSISEITRVKNLNRLQIGKHEVDAWYFSPYPKEYAHLAVLFICEFCLSYFPSSFMLARHRHRCTLLHPPGNEIYRHEDISFFELDGKRQVTWCRNLSLLSKCFLDQCVSSSCLKGAG